MDGLGNVEIEHLLKMDTIAINEVNTFTFILTASKDWMWTGKCTKTLHSFYIRVAIKICFKMKYHTRS